MSRTGEQSQARIQVHQRTADGFAVQLRSDSSGVLEIPGLEMALVSIHIGRAAQMSCRRAGLSHTGSAVHVEIDIIPADVASLWQMHAEKDRAGLSDLPAARRNTVDGRRR